MQLSAVSVGHSPMVCGLSSKVISATINSRLAVISAARLALATVMLLASRNPERIGVWVTALTLAMVFTTIVLAASNWLERMFGTRVVTALQRLTGLVLTALAVEMLLAGVRTFVAELAR